MNAPFAPSRSGRVLPDLTQGPAQAVPARMSRRGRPRLATEDRVRALFASGMDDVGIASELGCSVATVLLRRRALGLLRRQRRRKAVAAANPAPTLPQPKPFHSRHEPKPLDDKVARMPPVNHPALTDARTIYPVTVVPAVGLLNLLVEGDNSWKIGGLITKGRWRGFPVYTLTLQERATCPTSCAVWRSCYGNQMNWAKRIAHGPELEERLGFEIGLLSYRHPAGFAVRLHVLGDFYSVRYVDLWRGFLDRFPSLHVFGFSARVDGGDPVAAALGRLIEDRWPRFAIRLSNATSERRSTSTIEHPLQKPSGAIICPQQTGRTASCGTCALCWSTDRRIAFLRH